MSWNIRASRLRWLGTTLVVAVFGLLGPTALSANLVPGAKAAVGDSPDDICTETATWDYDGPTLSGTAKVGYTLTSSSGNVFCAANLQAVFYRTYSDGTIQSVAYTGQAQACPNPGFLDCLKSDSYTLTAS
jgi:hypothetical protein